MTFDEIPQNIKNSLFSERVDEILDDIRDKACISNPALLPGAFYDLIAKETPAHYFIESLAETGIGEKIAKSVAKAIKERILESERYPLFRWGVDISEIKAGDAEDIEHLGLKEDLEPAKEERTIHLESLDASTSEPETIPILRTEEVPPEIKKEETATPFVLQGRPEEARPASGFSGRVLPSFSMGFFKSKKPVAVAGTKTVKAEVETRSSNAKRVVHYMESRSTISPFEVGGEFLKTEEIVPLVKPPVEAAVPEKPAEEKPFINTIAKKQEPKPAETGPTLEGNVINLKG